ncbi:MAG: hypothetical protein RE471_00020 [Ferroplasma sp.]|uniref:hypothetical protein n=1 Tax=Ferroplasma sp. TaxID=2591003 RepID=UPI002815A172|nr:hypothetical protein [Ferroplasma sp.]WMT51288.1 MAG: hypothetical protein RE471_00020 [Ferroplasma sp.]
MYDDDDDEWNNELDEREIEYDNELCPDCKSEIEFKIQIHRGFSDWEHLICPVCEHDFGERRVDEGYESRIIKRGTKQE